MKTYFFKNNKTMISLTKKKEKEKDNKSKYEKKKRIKQIKRIF